MIIREYKCDECETNFSVIHSDDLERNAICSWCGSKISETGKTQINKDGWVIELTNGIETSRRKI